MSNVNITYRLADAGATFCHNPGDIVTIETTAAAALVAAGIAFPEGPAPSGCISTLYDNAGFNAVVPGPSGWHDADTLQPYTVTSTGAYCWEGPLVLRVIYPGAEQVFDVMKRRP